MEKTYQPQHVEQKWYERWEREHVFTPEAKIRKGETPFTIILPPPNANANLHVGHAMYTIEDILIRYHRMKGDTTLWLPGADHAGFETQFVFEKQLAKEGKSRFDFPRDTLYQMIWDFVAANRGKMENQLRRLGFSLDWTRNIFTLDPQIVRVVYTTFKKLYDDGLIYRGLHLVNYCTKDGTGFSDLEVVYVERNDPLYYMKYGPFTIATARPETKFRDTALAVHPKDKRYKDAIGKTYEIMGLLGPIQMQVIPDPHIDPDFGTGIMKVTPAHDPHDFELGQQFHLPITPIIDFRGRMDFSWFLNKKNVEPKYKERAEKYHGKKIAIARQLMVEDLREDGLLFKVDEKYVHRIGTCYKCGTVIEPLPLPQWYVKVQPLVDKAVQAIKKKKTAFVPKRFEKTALQWLNNFHDWNISRQIVWGIRIPAWRCKNHPEEKWITTSGETPSACPDCGNTKLEQETDTFDTWFSSGQWPFATLKANHSGDFDRFYPTSVMETGYDILPQWVCRMMMLGLYMTGDVPFRTVYLHGLVRDAKGQKMSKSKGNVVNPRELVEKYGADALRFALLYGTGAGHDISLSEDKIRGMRNFANKLWNIARFLRLGQEQISHMPSVNRALDKEEKQMEKKTQHLVKDVTKSLEKFQIAQGAEKLYEFLWHEFADGFLEQSKEKLLQGDHTRLYALLSMFRTGLTLLHPYMPFITEELHGILTPNRPVMLVKTPWPQGASISLLQS